MDVHLLMIDARFQRAQQLVVEGIQALVQGFEYGFEDALLVAEMIVHRRGILGAGLGIDGAHGNAFKSPFGE